MICPKCHTEHDPDRCQSHVVKDPDTREPIPPRQCEKHPVKGSTVCRSHGAAEGTPARAAAEARLERAAAEREVARTVAEAFGGQAPEVDLTEAMVQVISMKYIEVQFYRAKVAELSDRQMVWGKTRVKAGGEDYGTTKEARPNIWLSLLHEAQRDLIRFGAQARAAGCDERRVQLAEQQGVLLAGVVRRIVERFYQALVDLLGDEHAAALAAVDAAWPAWMAEIVPGELRAIEAGGAV